MCLLLVWRPHILPLDHQVSINSMIKFHLKWWMNTNHFVLGMPIHPPDPNLFLYKDASHYGWVHNDRTNESILSWSLVGRPIPTPYQYTGNNGHLFRTEESLKICSPFLCHDFYRQHNSGLLYQQTRRNLLSQHLCRGRWGDPPLVPGTTYSCQGSSYPRQIQCFGRPPIENGQTSQKRMGIRSISRELDFPNVQFPQCGSVCDSLQSQISIVCFSSSGQTGLSDRCFFCVLEPTSCLCISSNNIDIFCPGQDMSISVQNSSYSPSLAPTTMVLRGTTTTSFSSSSSSTLSKTTDTSKRKVSTSKPPVTRSSCLGVIKQSITDKNLLQNVADFVSKSRRTSTQKVYDAKWIVCSNWCHRKKINPVSAPLTIIADFLIYLFSERKYQISMIKGYRSMISNTLKFKTGNKIGSNPVYQN